MKPGEKIAVNSEVSDSQRLPRSEFHSESWGLEFGTNVADLVLKSIDDAD